MDQNKIRAMLQRARIKAAITRARKLHRQNIAAMAELRPRGWRAVGFEIACSIELAQKLRAHFPAFAEYPYAGAGLFHWDSGYLWWIEPGEGNPQLSPGPGAALDSRLTHPRRTLPK